MDRLDKSDETDKLDSESSGGEGISLPKLEEEILDFWEKNEIFNKSLKLREGGREFRFLDGPPFATGLPHFGHFIPSTIKDIIPRYKTMRGFHVPRVWGWDCHGLPVENLVEKSLGINSKHEIEQLGVEKFNKKCRESVLTYTAQWEATIKRLGRWVDFKNCYRTMDRDYMERVWAVAKDLWDKGLVRRGSRVLPYCPRCSTVLATHELEYQNDTGPAITVRFQVEKIPESIARLTEGSIPIYILAWTTTPWTLPSNTALAVGPDITYLLVRDLKDNVYYILAKDRISSYYKNESDYSSVWVGTGRDLVGGTYHQILPYYKGGCVIIPADYVTTTDGTGVVHIAPAFGEDDERVWNEWCATSDEHNKKTCLKDGGVFEPMDAECAFTEAVKDFAGREVFDCNSDIIKMLKAGGSLVKREDLTHQYPHCWRCKSPLVYRSIGSWFVSVSDHHKELLDANEKITWRPAHIKHGRFGQWLAGARDWAVSRNRYWGNPIPIWVCDKCNKAVSVGSRKELKDLSGVDLSDLHKEFVDKVTWQCECGGVYRRTPEVFDCWFESGSAFRAGTGDEGSEVADFISEGLDQTRGWFYTLTVLSALLEGRPPFLNCTVTGLVLASDGRKMSKSLRNYTDPAEVLEKSGADALRFYLSRSVALEAGALKFSDEGVRQVAKDVLIPLWNAYKFYETYGEIDGIFKTGETHKTLGTRTKEDATLDRWLISRSNRLIADMTTSLDDYNIKAACDNIERFIDDMNNWYIRLSRRRFWAGWDEADTGKGEAYDTLECALRTLSTVAAPIIPFLTEAIFQKLRGEGDPISVHLMDYPSPDELKIDDKLEREMSLVRLAVNLGRSVRNENNIKNRQPLGKATLVSSNSEDQKTLKSSLSLIKAELNVRQIDIISDETTLVTLKAKANFRTLGAKFGSKMKALAALISTFDSKTIALILKEGTHTLTLDGNPVDLSKDDLIVTRQELPGLKAAAQGSLTVVLDTNITQDLLDECEVKTLIRAIQLERKKCALAVNDRIRLRVDYGDSPRQKDLLEKFSSLIKSETLAIEIITGESKDLTPVEIDSHKWAIAVERASGAVGK